MFKSKADKFVKALIEDRCTLQGNPRYRCISLHAASFDVVIDGKRYDSEALQQIASYEPASEWGNMQMEESLWKSGKGAWLLAGEGMQSTVWAFDDQERSGYGYIALSPEEARTWLELRGLSDVLLEHFAVDNA